MTFTLSQIESAINYWKAASDCWQQIGDNSMQLHCRRQMALIALHRANAQTRLCGIEPEISPSEYVWHAKIAS